MSPTKRLEQKLFIDRCLVCSIWQMFFSWSLTDSIRARLRKRTLSCRCIREFFIFRLRLVIMWISSTNNRSNRSCEMYPLSATSLPKSLLVKASLFKGSRSSVAPCVTLKVIISPLSLITRCSLKPWNQPRVDLPVCAQPLRLRCWWERLMWQARSGVESMNEIPVQGPRQQRLRKTSDKLQRKFVAQQSDCKITA